MFSFIVALILSLTLAGQAQLTGDVLNGFPVISSLNLSQVPSNHISRFYFLAGTQFGSIPLYLPVFVARGTPESLHSGRRLSLSASIHGDELNGVSVVQRVFNDENFQRHVHGGTFNGTVIGLPTMNPNGNQHSQRLFYSGVSNGRWSDLNRLFPGQRQSSLASTYVYNIWNGLWGNTTNVDIAVDLHTVSTGSESILWAYADYRFPYVQRMAELVEADMIKIDPGDGGTVETTFIEHNVPAITLEVGTPKVWLNNLITRSEAFVFRLMADIKMIPNGSTTFNNNHAYRATNFSDVATTKTGWIELLVRPLGLVTKGQAVAKVYNSWGDTLEVLNSTVSGMVMQSRTDPIVEQGTGVVTIGYNATTS